MGYSEALQAAGANVIAFKEFGSYQGDWAAFVELNGEQCIIQGSYGSCSGCDAFEGEFCYEESPYERDGKYLSAYGEEITKDEYDNRIKAYNKRLADFGAGYLASPSKREIIETQIANVDEQDCFDSERKEMLEWCLQQFKINTLNN